jgi:carbon-monoxide dehydrogenase medium subunit
MRPSPFALHRAASVGEALALKAEHGDDASFYAGGTELLVALKARVLRYGHLIDIKPLAELRAIEAKEDGTLAIGALCTHHAIATHPLVRKLLPAYAALSGDVGNIRVRMAGTIGGVLCFAEPHADAPTLLAALDARVRLSGPEGERTVPSREFHLGEFTTARRDDELLVAIEVPPLGAGNRAAYRCFRHTERPAVGVAAVWKPRAPRCLDLWVGAIGGVPTRMTKSENAAMQLPAALRASEAWERLQPVVEDEARALEASDDLHGSADYKRHLAAVLAQRALEACLA